VTDHPCKGLPKSVRNAFERIAVGMPTGAAHPTIVKLLAAGLIVVEMKHGRDALGSYSWPEYHVPLPVHMQWCKWCSENITDAEIAAASR
jgi:hypothetical protein